MKKVLLVCLFALSTLAVMGVNYYPPSAQPWVRKEFVVKSDCERIPFTGGVRKPSRAWVSIYSEGNPFHADVIDRSGNILRSTSGKPRKKVKFRFVQKSGYSLRICKIASDKSTLTLRVSSN